MNNKVGVLDLSQIKVGFIQNPRIRNRILLKKFEKRNCKTPYKSDSLKKRTAIIPSAPSAKKIVTPSLLKMQRGPPKIIQITGS